MKKTPQKDIVILFQQFQKDVLDKKPHYNQMFDEVRMMKFKVRPVTGDIGALDFKNSKFVETLWSLGKLDEFFQKEIKKLSNEEKQVFYRLFDDVYQDYQSQLNDINIKADKFDKTSDLAFEVEIFREKIGSN